MTYIKHPTPDQKREWAEKARKMQKEATDVIHSIVTDYVQDPEHIVEMLEFGSRFYNYSYKNTILIQSQNPYAQYIQSFDAWRKMGYSVKKGEQGLKIFVPVRVTLLQLENGDTVSLKYATQEQKDAYKRGELPGTVTTRFQIGNVFDISQTTFPKEEYPKLFSMGYPSEMHYGICEGLKDFCKTIGYTVKEVDFNSINLRGKCNGIARKIEINTLLEDTQRVCSLAHEIGHALEHHSERDVSLAQKELEADAVSIMLQTGFGIEISDVRKRHFKNHFDDYVNELEVAAGHSLDTDDMLNKLDELLDAVTKTYRENIESINSCVEKYVPKERLFEFEQNKIKKDRIQEACKLEQERSVSNSLELEQSIELGK